MLYALLFDSNDALLAAAPAASYHAASQIFWQEIYASEVALNPECQTAIIETEDEGLSQLLATLELDDAHLAECRRRVSQMFVPMKSGNHESQHPKAA